MGFIMTLMLWSHSPSITLSCLSSFFSSSSSSHLAVLLLCERDLVSGTQIAHRSMNTLPVAVQLKKCLPLSHLLCRRCWDHVLSETACQGRLSALDTHTHTVSSGSHTLSSFSLKKKRTDRCLYDLELNSPLLLWVRVSCGPVLVWNIMLLRMALNFWSPCLHLPSAGITSVNFTLFTQHWEWDPGFMHTEPALYQLSSASLVLYLPC